MADLMFKYSSTDQTMTFPAAGVFADSGDNYQNSISATYIHMLGKEGKLMIMPRVGLNRTHYLKKAQAKEGMITSSLLVPALFTSLQIG